MGGGELSKPSGRIGVSGAAAATGTGRGRPIHAGGERVGTLPLLDCKPASPTPACVVGLVVRKIKRTVCPVDLRHV